MASDPIKEHERDIDGQVNEGRKFLAEITPKLAPRPVGTTKVSAENVKWDYDNRGPEYYPELFDKFLAEAETTSQNATWAVIELAKHVKGIRDGSST